MRISAIVVALAIVATACSSTAATDAAEPASTPVATPRAERSEGLIDSDGEPFPDAPPVPAGPLDEAIAEDLTFVMSTLELTSNEVLDERHAAIERIGESGDPRALWPLIDLLRFLQPSLTTQSIRDAFGAMTGVDIGDPGWGVSTNHMIAWDIPAPDGYVEWKRVAFELVEPAWEPFFSDPDAAIDYRFLSWGGVFIDDRSLDRAESGANCIGGCIPAINNPAVTDAAGGDWYPDEGTVFGVVINGEARAYPKNIMEVHEMVNDTLGGREIGMPYCTLCGSAQVYFTDEPPEGFEILELRTSGLLQRSNKFMYEFHTQSGFDTFTGEAVSGPLREAGVVLEQATVITSTWADWKAAYPDTTIIAEDGGIGRTYDADPLRGRDDNGPIFPIGDVDDRLPVQEPVLGVLTAAGTPVAFQVATARAALENGETVELGGISLMTDGAGLRAVDAEGNEVAAHESFWFAWSQFQEDSLLWQPGLG